MTSDYQEKITEIRKEVADTYLKNHEELGSYNTLINIYYSLFFCPRPLGLDDISKLTGYSKSTVCTAMDLVERLMDVRKFKRPGSKKVYYECTHDTFLIHQKRMQEMRKQIPQLVDVLRSSEDRLKDETAPEAVQIRDFLKERRESYERFDHMFDEIKSKICQFRQ